VPDHLREKTEITLTAEIYQQADAILGVSPFQDTLVLDHTFNDVDLVGRPLSISQFVNRQSLGSPVFASITNTYLPYIAVGDYGEPVSADELIGGTDFQEVITNFPLGNQILTGLFLKIGLSGPSGPAVQVLRVPGTSEFLLLVSNTGNTEDAYRATIITANGPVKAQVMGLDGLPAAAIPSFRLPGLSTGALLLQAALGTVGTGTVTVEIDSLSDPTITTTVKATVATVPPPPHSRHGRRFGPG
jgi:hypothetical protein